LTAARPSGVPAPALLARQAMQRDVLGANVTALAYFPMTVSATTAISSTPAFTVALPTAASGDCYIVVYDPTSVLGTGWNQVLGPVSCGTTDTFPSQSIAVPITLTAGVNYVFALITSGTVLPTPTPTPNIIASPTSLSFTSSTPLPVTVSEAGYTGAFTALSSAPTVATASVTGNTVTVTPVGGGTATITISDANNNSVQVPVSVTAAIFQPQLHHR